MDRVNRDWSFHCCLNTVILAYQGKERWKKDLGDDIVHSHSQAPQLSSHSRNWQARHDLWCSSGHFSLILGNVGDLLPRERVMTGQGNALCGNLICWAGIQAVVKNTFCAQAHCWSEHPVSPMGLQSQDWKPGCLTLLTVAVRADQGKHPSR